MLPEIRSISDQSLKMRILCGSAPILIVPIAYFVSSILIPVYKASIEVDFVATNVSEEFWRYLAVRVWFSVLAAIVTGSLVSWVAWRVNQFRHRLLLYMIPSIYLLHEISLSIRDYVAHYGTYYDVLIQGFYGAMTLAVIYGFTKFFEVQFEANGDAINR